MQWSEVTKQQNKANTTNTNHKYQNHLSSSPYHNQFRAGFKERTWIKKKNSEEGQVDPFRYLLLTKGGRIPKNLSAPPESVMVELTMLLICFVLHFCIQSNITWSQVPDNESHYNESHYDIPLPSSEAGNNLFGIAVTDTVTDLTSGIFWTECIFVQKHC